MIPPLNGTTRCLPDGRHPATLDEIEERFVREAPFQAERQIVFDAFRVWHSLIAPHLIGSRLWVDGGFATHKEWAPPSDVDVTVMVKAADLNALDVPTQNRILDLMTKPSSAGKVQPMSGLVDAYVFTRGDVDATVTWLDTWKTVLDEHRNPVPNVRKGFLEVRL